MNTWQYGNTITLKGTFTTEDGVYQDPITVKVGVLTPAGVLTTYEYGVDNIVKVSTGIYTLDIVPTEVGIWYHRWYSDAADEVSKEVYFEVTRVRAI